jgi:hypothetical protein
MFFGPGKEPGNDGQRIIFVLVNRLSEFLTTKRDINRTVNEFRFLLRKRVNQRLNGQRIRAEAKKEKDAGSVQ